MRLVKRALKGLPGVGELLAERDRYHSDVVALRKNLGPYPPGHFYSPVPAIDELAARAEKLFVRSPRTLPGIDLREESQLGLLSLLASYYGEQPFPENKQPPLRYYFENGAYSYSDAIFLYCMMRHLRPKRMIESGSGFSSCAMLDTNELFFDGKIRITHIEPYPQRLHSLVRPEERDRLDVLAMPLQDVPLSLFAELNAGDILFVDSTHVSKTGSDVNHLAFEVLPRLRSGVYVHLHDIFFPFEYPRAWVIEEKRGWNESYLLRAFLQYNAAFEIVLMNTFLEEFHRQWFEEQMPLCLRNPGGSIWLRRI